MKASKEKQVRVLKTNIKLWNRYIRFCLSVNVEFSANLRYTDLSSADLSYADLRSADLSYADLSYANLRYADLSYADLSYANLRSANLSSADLSYADLSYADLSSANLRYTDLSYANLDMSCLPLWCGSLKAKFDIKLRVQIGFHFASLIKNGTDITDEEKQIYNSILEYVNKFHCTDDERLKPIE